MAKNDDPSNKPSVRHGGAPRVERDPSKDAQSATAAVGQEDPVPARAEGTGFPDNRRSRLDRSAAVNPNKDRPNEVDLTKQPPPGSPIFKPGHAVVAESPEHAPQAVAVTPYGSEPQGLDPKTGDIIATPPKDEGNTSAAISKAA
jgi:hypothetical protein